MNSFGKQLTQFLVGKNRVIQVIQHSRTNAASLQVLTDSLGQYTRNILVRLVGKLFEVFPDRFFDFGTDFDSSHLKTIVDMS